MEDLYLYCYSTNNEMLGEYTKQIGAKFKDNENLHNTVSLLSSLQALVSGALCLASDTATITLDNPKIGSNTLAKKAILSLKYQPVKDLKDILLDESTQYKKITQNLEHDNFSLYDNETLGLIVKYTTHIHCQNETNYKKISPILGTYILNKILSGFCTRDLNIQIPIGKQLFNIKIKTIINY
jgi:hypothetical protein